jgi:putative sterol carrier protein
MPIPFGSDEWIKAVMAELNTSAAYHEAAKHWEGDICLVVQSGPGVDAEMSMYMDLWHGACREAYRVNDVLTKRPEFTIAAPLATWRRVLEKKIDPIQAVVTFQLKLKGNMIKVMKAPKAAVELVNCCTRVPTQWPQKRGDLVDPRPEAA